MERSPELLESVLKEHPEWKSRRVAEYTGYSKRHVRRKRKELYDAVDTVVEVREEDVYIENAKLRKEAQALRDKLRVLRKDDRTSHRYQNVAEELTKELIDAIEKRAVIVGKQTKEHNTIDTNSTGILQLNDLHLNEIISIDSNVYDFYVAARRLKKLIRKAIFIFKLANVKEVVITILGDVLNSDRRLSEILCSSCSRARACMIAVHLLSQVIVELNQDFSVSVVSVSGNESRMQEYVEYDDHLMSDNYDYLIHKVLEREFKHAKGVKFLPSNNVEQIIEVQGQNILLLHGNQIPSGDTGLEKKIQQIKGKHNTPISYVLLGHLHSCRIGDLYSRGSSLCGANAYSELGLLLSSRASQNIHIVYEGGGIDSVKIDLQNTDGVSGYDIDSELARSGYSIKSADKVNFLRGKTI